MNNEEILSKFFRPIIESTPSRFGTTKYPEIVRYFNKTPPTIVCPHFWELNWGYGCWFNCSYCYLQGTFRGKTEPRHLPLKHIIPVLNEAFSKIEKPSVFNSGELTDSFAYPSIMEKIIDEFEKQNKHKLLLLTKSSNVGFLIQKPKKQIIVSFSINAPIASKRWERKTAPPEMRIQSAKKVSEIGYETRIRIDPIFPIPNWRKKYGNLIEYLLSKLTPERITLGTPRGLAKTLMFSKDLSWAKFFDEYSEKSGWGKKINPSLRKEIYLFFFDKLSELGFNKSKIALCKENFDLWKDLELDPGKYPDWKNCKCNCVV